LANYCLIAAVTLAGNAVNVAAVYVLLSMLPVVAAAAVWVTVVCCSVIICIHVNGINVQYVEHVLVGNVPKLAGSVMEGYSCQTVCVRLMNESLEERVQRVWRCRPCLEFLDGKNARLY
jgi:hypothetical protein